jgi:hypothetical protein
VDKLNDFNIGHVGAFMFKHIRANTDITYYEEEFRCIRHGHYDELFERVKTYFPEDAIESPILTIYNGHRENATPTSDKTVFTQRLQCDFVGLMNNQPAMYYFSKLLLKAYGAIADEQFETKVFQQVVLFELGLRNALCNDYIKYGWDHNLIAEMRMELTDVIDELSWINEYNPEQIELLNKGRQFRNYVKTKELRRAQFSSPEEALEKFHSVIRLTKELEIALYSD